MNIHLLDCTIRDGGYLNDWKFQDLQSLQIVNATLNSGVRFSEVGFLRNCEYQRDIQLFNNIKQIDSLYKGIAKDNLAIMVELGYGYSYDNFPPKDHLNVSLVRITVWKRMLDELPKYVKNLIEKGYKVAIQLTRCDQYTINEIKEIAKQLSKIGIYAIYIVDTFGRLKTDQVLEYAFAIDNCLLDDEQLIGYHGHNNLNYALKNSISLCQQKFKHDIIIDATIIGIGKGAGNLQLEVIQNYLNDEHDQDYKINQLFSCVDFIDEIKKKNNCGYSIAYMLSARYNCNPSYISYMQKMNLSIEKIQQVLEKMNQSGNGIKYNANDCDKIINELQ